MIKPDDIQSTIEPDPLNPNYRKIRTHLSIGRMRVALQGEASEEMTTREKERLWHYIYGDLERPLLEFFQLARSCIVSGLPGSNLGMLPNEFEAAKRKIDALITNPFRK